MREPKNNQALVEHLVVTGALCSEPIIEAFKAVDRADFVSARDKTFAYRDHPLRIGAGQTISQPTTVAYMLEWLEPGPGMKVLDVGSGSGWTTALLAQIVGETGQVVGVELRPELVKFGRDNLRKYDFKQAKIETARPHTLGWPRSAPYNRILVSATGNDMPKTLIDQLKGGGRLVVPVGYSIFVIDKTEQGIATAEHPGFSFVPLVED